MIAAYERSAELILARSIADPAEGCIRFTGYLSEEGYGQAFVRGVGTRAAHRVVYIAATSSPIPDGLTLDHLCHTRSQCPGDSSCLHRSCVNPDHLEPVTARENAQRGWRARQPACRNGHPFDEANTYLDARGHRSCRTCNRDAARRYKERRMLRAAGGVR